jgi:glutamate synthase (NADPH/NADH) large chain
MSKMGISTYQSYCGAQIFDAVGLKPDSSRQYFTGTATTIEGVGLPRSPRRRCAATRTPSATIPVLHNARCRRRICLPHARRGAHVDAG